METEKLMTDRADINMVNAQLEKNNGELSEIKVALTKLLEFMYRSEERHEIEQERRDQDARWRSKVEDKIEKIEDRVNEVVAIQNKRSWVTPALGAICMGLLSAALTYIGVK